MGKVFQHLSFNHLVVISRIVVCCSVMFLHVFPLVRFICFLLDGVRDDDDDNDDDDGGGDGEGDDDDDDDDDDDNDDDDDDDDDEDDSGFELLF